MYMLERAWLSQDKKHLVTRYTGDLWTAWDIDVLLKIDDWQKEIQNCEAIYSYAELGKRHGDDDWYAYLGACRDTKMSGDLIYTPSFAWFIRDLTEPRDPVPKTGECTCSTRAVAAYGCPSARGEACVNRQDNACASVAYRPAVGTWDY